MNRLREVRKSKNLTLVELGKAMNIPKSNLSRYENGESEPKLDTWINLASFFDVPVGYLQGVTDSKTGLDDATTTAEMNLKYANMFEERFIKFNPDVKQELTKEQESSLMYTLENFEGVLWSYIPTKASALESGGYPDDKETSEIKLKILDELIDLTDNLYLKQLINLSPDDNMHLVPTPEFYSDVLKKLKRINAILEEKPNDKNNHATA